MSERTVDVDTVGDLIELLQEFDKEDRVRIRIPETGMCEIVKVNADPGNNIDDPVIIELLVE